MARCKLPAKASARRKWKRSRMLSPTAETLRARPCFELTNRSPHTNPAEDPRTRSGPDLTIVQRARYPKSKDAQIILEESRKSFDPQYRENRKPRSRTRAPKT